MHAHTQTHTHTPHARTHTHTSVQTQTLSRLLGLRTMILVEMLREEKCLESVFEGRERIRVSDILGEVVPDMRSWGTSLFFSVTLLLDGWKNAGQLKIFLLPFFLFAVRCSLRSFIFFFFILLFFMHAYIASFLSLSHLSYKPKVIYFK